LEGAIVMAWGMAGKAAKKATKKNNDSRAQRMDPTSTSHKMAEAGMVNQIDPPNYHTKRNKNN